MFGESFDGECFPGTRGSTEKKISLNATLRVFECLRQDHVQSSSLVRDKILRVRHVHVF